LEEENEAGLAQLKGQPLDPLFIRARHNHSRLSRTPESGRIVSGIHPQ
jgi:hypothetical protein